MICYNCMQPIHSIRCPYCGFDSTTYLLVPTTLLPETVLHGTYVLGRVLGKGGFGVTYIGFDRVRGSKVAIKEYFPSAIATRNTTQTNNVRPIAEMRTLYDKGVRKFYDEAVTLAQLAGIPAIVQVYDFFYENETAYIVMEYINGVTIEQIVKTQGPLTLDLVLTIYYPILRALEAVHQKGILHRDISPCNVILDEYYTSRLIDFGSSRAFSSEMSSDMSVILKNGFAPIEQYTRSGKHGPWEDIYALSASMYYTLTGKIPPAATDRLVFDTLEPISNFDVDIPTQLERVILTGMAIRTADRYHSVAQMCADIDAIADATVSDPLSSGNYFNPDSDTDNSDLYSNPKSTLPFVLMLAGMGAIGLLVCALLYFL